MLFLKENNVQNFEKIYNDMLLQFPKCELKEKDTFIKLLKNGSYKLYTAETEKETVGYILLFADEKNSVLWLDYIAVFKKFHSQGYGGKIFENLKRQFSDFKGIFLEVEKPDQGKQNTIRRVKFYLSKGAKLIDCKYFYPNQQGCFEMNLYFLSFQKNFHPSPELTKETIKNTFETLHCDIKHIKDVMNKIVI